MNVINGRLSLYSLLFTVAMGASNSYGQKLSLIADSQHPIGLDLNWSMKMAPNGDIYATSGAFATKGVVRITAPLEVETVFTATNPDYIVSSPKSQTWVPQDPVILEGIADYVADAWGNLYVASSISNNVVAIYANGTIKELIGANGDNQGNVLDGGISIALGSNDDLYVLSKTAKSLFKVNRNGEVSLIMGEQGVGGHLFTPQSSILTNRNRELFIASADAFFKISFADEVSIHLEEGLEFLKENPFDKDFVFLEVDDFGNVYFVRSSARSTVFRYSAQSGIERIIGSEGDGTGEVVCAKSGPQEHDPIVCEGFGNYLFNIAGLHIDAAQNLFVVGRDSKNVFKVTSTKSVSEVGDFSNLENFDFEVLRSSAFDETGNLYLLHAKTSGSGVSLFSYSPMPVENAEDFSLSAPHAEVSHNNLGVDNSVSSYTTTSIKPVPGQEQLIHHLDTRSEVFGSLPWQDGNSQLIYTSSFSSVLTTTIDHEGSTYLAEMVSRHSPTNNTRHIYSLRYFMDGTQVYAVSGLDLPYEHYLRYSNQALMSWFYIGNDIIYGGEQTDILYGYDGHDFLYGFGGDDLLDGGAGNNIFYGGDGDDTVVYEQKMAAYMLSKDPETGFVSVQAKTGYGAYVDKIALDVERIRFNDFEITTENLGYWGEQASVEFVDTENAPANVYRFFNTSKNAFFYTTNAEEREMVLRNSGPENRNEVNWPYVYQGAKFQTAHSYPGAVPLYRFYNTRTGHHFFTINETERDSIIDKIANDEWTYVFEGVAFEVYATNPAPDSPEKVRPVYRFYSHTLNRHVFTTSEKEYQLFEASADWTSEGVGFYAESVN